MFTAVVVRRPIIEVDMVEIQPPDIFDFLNLRHSRFAWLIPPNQIPTMQVAGRFYTSDALIKIDGVLPDGPFDVHTHDYELHGVFPVERIDGNIFRCSVDRMEFR